MADTIASSVVSLEVDASGVSSGIAQATQSVQKFEQAATQAGAAAGDALGKGAQQGAQGAAELTREQQRLINTINNYQTSLGKTRGEVLEYRAAQAGLSDQLRAQIAAIKAQEAALASGGKQLNAYGQSAKQTAAALRGVPAQVTDIITSLQGGQAPLTVLFQQGGQLRDMFGGIAPAARALGGALLGLVNPYTVLAAAIIGVTYAYTKGAAETEEYNKALILTGNVAGTTAQQLNTMAANIDQSVGTQAQAAAALTAIASTGQVAGTNLEKFGATAVRISRTVGTSVEDTAKVFADLGKDPVKASEKLNESMNYLTLAVYDQIRAAQENGREQEAASIAQNAYADAMDKRTAKLEQNLGTIQRGWRAVKDIANEGWDAILGIGRPDGPGQNATPWWAKAGAASLGGIPGIAGAIGSSARSGLTSAFTSQSDKDAQAETARLAQRSAEQQAAADRQSALDAKAQIEARKRTEALKKETRDRADIRKDEIDQYKRDAATLNITADEQAKQIAKINDKYKDPKVAAPKAYQDDAATKYLMQLREQQAALEAQLGQTDKLTASARELAKFEAQIADIKEKKTLTADQKSLLANQDAIRAQLEKNVAVEDQVKAQQEATKELEKQKKLAEDFARQIESINQSIASSQQSRTDQYSRELGGIGQGTRARQEINAQRDVRREFERYQQQLNKQAAEKNQLGSDAYQQETVKIKAALDDALKAQQDYFDALKAAQADWRNGANEALANYLDDVNNAAGRAQTFLTDALKGGAPAITQGLWSGDWSGIKQLGDKLGQQLIEGIVQQQFMGPLAQVLQGQVNDKNSAFSSIFGGLFGTSDTGENWLGGLLGTSTSGTSTRGSSIANPLYVQSVNALGLGGSDTSDAIGGLISKYGLSSAANSSSSSGSWYDSAATWIGALFGRATGGGVSAGGMYQVAENGPELLTVGNRTMLMMGNQSGNVKPISSNDSVGGDTNVFNISVEGQVNLSTRKQIANDISLQQVQGRRYK